ncbi:MAG: DEAD/DEAH box helicase [Candidatus Wukongarchaeota archaeon]|nr:DEAD/DEAH box helicase [Candidatus Wukongarchaeota archaeon]
MAFIEHPLIKPEKIEVRRFQETIFARAVKGNTLVVLPTGLGKTFILVLVAALRLQLYGDGFVLILAPTRPLVLQHSSTFRDVLALDEGKIVAVSGQERPASRSKIYSDAKVVIATPQTVQNDIISGNLRLENCVLLGVDEAHRAVGDYAYVFIAERYVNISKNPLIFGITASPGSEEEKIREVCNNLFIEQIEVRSEQDADVKPYVQRIDTEWVRVELPPKFKRILELLETALKRRYKELKSGGFLNSANVKEVKLSDLLKLQGKIGSEISQTIDFNSKKELFNAISLEANCVRLLRAHETVQTQGITPFLRYMNGLLKQSRKKGSSRGLKQLVNEHEVKEAVFLAGELEKEKVLHPKVNKVIEIVKKTLKSSSTSRVLIFCQLRSTVSVIEKILIEEEVSASRFLGQAKRENEKGLTQKEQKEILENFKQGKISALVATSVAEEGLDIPQCDLVIMYDSVPSAIRAIQRRGRTGRVQAGKVIILIAKDTRDEAYYWVSKRREAKMNAILKTLQKMNKELAEKKQKSLEEFLEKEEEKPVKIMESVSSKETEKLPEQLGHSTNNQKAEEKEKVEEGEKEVGVIIDTQELSSTVAKALARLDLKIQVKRLSVGDYVVSDRVAIERKEVGDFLNSITDGRLFQQIIDLKNSFSKPILLLEGEELYSKKAINPQAIYGAIASIAIDFGIPILWSKSGEESALIISTIARREQLEKERTIIMRHEKPAVDEDEKQKFLVAGLPNIDSVLATRLLETFGTPLDVFNADEEMLQKARGIGPKTAKIIRKILTRKFAEK